MKNTHEPKEPDSSMGTPLVTEEIVVNGPTIEKDNFLPISILVAGIMISGSVLYSKSPSAPAPAGGNPAAAAPSGNVAELLKSRSRDAILGEANAPVTFIEYADFQCPFCGRLFTNVSSRIREDYVKPGKVKMIYRHLAFLGPESIEASEASECAKDQSKFWAFHDALYGEEIQDGKEHNGNLNRALFEKISKQVGMDTKAFLSCYDGNKYAAYVKEETSAAQNAGISATPNSFVNGTRVQGAVPYEQFKAAIDRALSL